MLLTIGTGLIVANCRDKPDCVPPPPSLQLWLTSANGTALVDSSNAKRVAIRYFKSGQLTPLKDVQVKFVMKEIYVQSYGVIRVASESADTAQFYVAIGDKPAGVFQLKTDQRNTSCGRSTQISELRYNGIIIPYDNMEPGYRLVVP